MKNEDIQKELLALSKTLADIPRIEDRTTPDGYFEALPDVTWMKISDSHNTEPKKTKVLPLFGKILGIAASFAILFFVMKGLAIEEAESEIPIDAMVEFIMNDIGEQDEDLLFELHIESNDMEDLDDETLNYILEEGIDLIEDKFLETLY